MTIGNIFIAIPLRAVAARWRWLAPMLLVLLAAAPAAAAQWLAGPPGSPLPLAEAVRKAADGDTIDLLPGEYTGGLVLENRRLTLRGVGTPAPRIQGGGQAVAARALWTVRGGDVTIENLEFRGARSNEGNGAGVWLEGGRLRIVGCVFFDNEHGVYAANDEQAELTIDSTVIGLAPRVAGALYHLLNVGRIARLTVVGSRFQQGYEGHMIKTRARENTITYNFIHDGRRGGASYELEIADGGIATVVGNVLGQGSASQNPVVLSYGSEGRGWDRNVLYVAHNTFVHYGWLPGWFLRVRDDRLKTRPEVWVVNNLLVGPALLWPSPWSHFVGNRYVGAAMLADIETYAFELPPGSPWRNSGVDPRNVGGVDLAPKAEFKWPVGIEPLPAERSLWVPGAYQR